MKTTTIQLDVSSNMQSRTVPVYQLKREVADSVKQDRREGRRIFQATADDVHYVARSIISPETIEWSLVRDGDTVAIPVFAYYLPKEHAHLIAQNGLQVGLMAFSSLAPKLDRMPAELVIVAGSSLYLSEDGSSRYCLGLAFRMPNPKRGES